MGLAWQQLTAMLVKRFQHSRRDWKGLIAQLLLPVLFVIVAMGLGCIKSDVQHYPELELSPALYKIGPSYSFFRSDPFGRNKLQATPEVEIKEVNQANQGSRRRVVPLQSNLSVGNYNHVIWSHAFFGQGSFIVLINPFPVRVF